MPEPSEAHAIIAAGVRRREAPSHGASIRGLDRVEISVIEGLSYEAHNANEPHGLMRIGEPIDRGGDDTGNSPLAHFLAGIGACILNQFVRVAITERMGLELHGASVRGEFQREAGGRFQRIVCEIRATGSIDATAAEQLVARAERLCYLHQTLVQTVEMTTVFTVGESVAVRHVDGPLQDAVTATPSPP